MNDSDGDITKGFLEEEANSGATPSCLYPPSDDVPLRVFLRT